MEYDGILGTPIPSNATLLHLMEFFHSFSPYKADAHFPATKDAPPGRYLGGLTSIQSKYLTIKT
jgi:hypothetical protein